MNDDVTDPGCSVTAVVPAYNEARRIGQVVHSLIAHVDRVLVVDDGSTDATARQAEEAGATVLVQPVNKGYIPALKRGFSVADTDVVVTIDADGEFPVHRLPDLVRPVCNGTADMVQGHRDHIVRPSERFLTWLARWGGEVGDSGTGFRALRTDLAEELSLRGNCICGVFSLEVLGLDGKISEIPIKLNEIEKPRGIAWYHLGQVFYVLAALIQRSLR
jgi:glycosyltransferase involved in cell wall biosynthesis